VIGGWNGGAPAPRKRVPVEPSLELGQHRLIARAATVDVGTTLIAAARARRGQMVRTVSRFWVRGVRVDGGHQARSIPNTSSSTHRHRRQTVGRARGIRDDGLRAVIGAVLTPSTVRSAPLEVADTTTFFAPPCR